MSKNNLLIKANNNYRVAEWAEKSAYYDVSVSRYYYTLYEKAKYIAKHKNFYKEPSNNKGSHIIFISDFHKNVQHLLNDSEIAFLAELNQLRKLRNKADYEEYIIISENEFNLAFKYHFNQINRIMDKLIE